jgi:hypothetical protein
VDIAKVVQVHRLAFAVAGLASQVKALLEIARSAYLDGYRDSLAYFVPIRAVCSTCVSPFR